MPVRNILKMIKGESDMMKHIIADQYEKGNDIPFDALHAFPNAFNIPSAGDDAVNISCRKLFQNDNVIAVKCNFPAYSNLGVHYHSDANEGIFIFGGYLVETISKVELTKGFEMKLSSGEEQKHNFVSGKKGAEIIVFFERK